MNIIIDYTMGSKCAVTGKQIFTCIAEFPRTMLSEFLTHRVFSKNTSSTRAIPIMRSIDITNKNPYIPEFTANQPGMIGAPITDKETLLRAEKYHLELLEIVSQTVGVMGAPTDKGGLNIHKQDAGRYLEPFQHIRMALTTTEIQNFMWLRSDEAAYPPIRKFAEAFIHAYEATEFMELSENEWHLPMVKRKRDNNHILRYYHPETQDELTLQSAQELSMSLLAQTSFRRNDSSETKTKTVTEQLFKGSKVHASPSEHQASPFSQDTYYAVEEVEMARLLSRMPEEDTKYLTAVEVDGQLRSGNFLQWRQLRQGLPNHDKAKF